jgi:hypothetical protein
MNETLRVTVAGLPKTGKTTVALAIADALRVHGMAVDYRDQDGVLPMRVLDQQPQRLAFLGQKGLRVALETVQSPRIPNGNGVAVGPLAGELSKLSPKAGDLVILTVPEAQWPNNHDAASIGSAIPAGCSMIVLPAGATLATLDDAQLADLGLQRIAEADIRPCASCGKRLPLEGMYHTGKVPGLFCEAKCAAKLLQDQALAEAKRIVGRLDHGGDPNA